MYKKLLGLTAPVAIVLLGTACTVQQTDIPGLSGPSELGLSIGVAASPDTITRNGYEQSKIIVTARDHNGAPKPDVGLRIDMVVNGVFQDLGTLVPRNVRTGSDGQATAVYTAPSAPHPLAGGLDDVVSIVVVPVGTNFQNGLYHTADIRLVRPGVILPPAQAPTAAFTITTTPVTLNLPAIFDASASCGGPVVSGVCTGGTITSYAWDFGDGGSGSGRNVSHTYAGVGSHVVTLTVTNDRGLSDTERQDVTIGASTAPQGTFVFSPTNPEPGQTIYFTEAMTPVAGRTNVSFEWNFGDGKTATGRTVTNSYATEQTFVVVLTVTDDIGRKAVVQRNVTVAAAP